LEQEIMMRLSTRRVDSRKSNHQAIKSEKGRLWPSAMDKGRKFMNRLHCLTVIFGLLLFAPAPSESAAQPASEKDMAVMTEMLKKTAKQLEAAQQSSNPAERDKALGMEDMLKMVGKSSPGGDAGETPADKPEAFAGSVKEYSADMVDVKSGRVARKLAVTPDKVFSEGLDDQGRRESIAILRLDQKKMYVFIEANKSYWELPFNKEHFTSADLRVGLAQVKREKVGTETVGGYRADKWRITATAMGLSSISNEWLTREFGFMPVRTEIDGVIQEMRNIKPGKPDASLFEIPKGYTRDTAMENMMKSVMGGK